MANKKKYWTGPEELNQTEGFLNAQNNEFMKDVSVDEFLGDNNLSNTSTNRRDFLKFLGFSVTAATIAACETPVIKSIPYVNKPEDITPGVPNYYASSFYQGNEFANIIVKTREGRPIYIKGNRKHGINQGAISAKVNSSVLSLYDSSRLKKPLIGGKEVTWPDLDAKLGAELSAIASRGGNISLLASSIISPSTQRAIEEFSQAYGGNVNVVSYDAISRSAIREANEASFGRSFIPSYDFSKAKTIVSIAADFLGDWLMTNEYSVQYAANRNPKADWMSRHFQFEALHSLTGSNADVRVPIKPSQEGAVAVALYNEIANREGKATLDSPALDNASMAGIKRAAGELYITKGASLVISGSNDPAVQQLINAINNMLGNYGKTIQTDVEVFIAKGNDGEVLKLVSDMNAGRVDALLVYDCNPAYSLPNADEFIAGLDKVGTTVSFASWEDETASRCKYVCPDNHYLESWNDYYPKTGHYALAQPTINALYDTRQFQETLLRLAGNSTGYMEFIKETWRETMPAEAMLFDDFWYNALRNGSVSVSEEGSGEPVSFAGDVTTLANSINSAKSAEGYEVVFYTKTTIGDGYYAANPWLQEVPDPITKVTWDNYITMNPAEAKEMGFEMYIGQESPASLAKVSVNGKELTLPVFPTPGQKRGTIGIALGYGRGANGEKIGRAAYRTKQYGGYELDDEGKQVPIGKNAYPLLPVQNGSIGYFVTGATVEGTGDTFPLACSQTHHTVMGRESVLKETTFKTFKSAPKEAYNPPHQLAVHEDGETVKKDVEHIDLWRHHPIKGVGHRWGMSIDLTSCTGCSACVTACISENNVPIVGKDEVRRSRDMFWLRIDRYFSSDMSLEKGEEEGLGVIETYSEMENPEYDTPQTVYMPMLCQHCNHAPCETVCPVAATTHSDEGLNQMAYNRCIGTRYCANNCPYKVRRFNWFNYKAYDKFADVNPSQDPISRMVLNPDVTVRSRGVMEKCTFCVQRIQEGKLDAKKEGAPIVDGAVQTACSEACATGAIKFGDLNDDASEVNELQQDDRTYYALEEIGTRPNVSYRVKVRNT